MNKNITIFLLAGVTSLFLCGCGNKEPENFDNIVDIGNEVIQESELSEENEERQEEFSFDALKNLQFWFSSGAGGWATQMMINVDGSFSGEYFDGDMGVTGEGYPNGTMYQCDFSGQFTHPVKVNEYTYSMQIRELNYAEEVGKEEIKDGMLYCYSAAYGLEDAEDILIYLPGAPLEELPEEFRSWIGYYDLSYTSDTELPFYALNNEACQYGFSSYDIVDSLKQMISATEERAASLEKSIKNDTLTQMEYNEKTQQLYELWDSALNSVWDVLKKTQEKEVMNSLTVEEREWIALKEQEVTQAGAAYEGGTIQAMVMNQKAAEMTKTRVYELLELFGFSEGVITESELPVEKQTDYSGKYTDKQGTLDDYSELQLTLQNDNTYVFTMTIYRVATIEGVAVYENGELHFVSDEPYVEGNIVISDDKAQVTVANSLFSEIQAGEAYSFSGIGQ